MFRQSMFWTLDRQAQSAWTQHVPFALLLVDVFSPRTIVELGTQNGVSYFALCQAVKSLGLPTRCFAVDTWKGDEHSGFYDENVYRDFALFHDKRYNAFSRLVRSTFDEALSHFEDRSIDLLHIDGLHTYEAVHHDFYSWLPKLAENAVVMFHDTNVRERNFGVFKFWGEISAQHPHFVFLHGHGLGIVGLGRTYSDPLRSLFDATEDGHLASSIRAVFAHLGRSIELFSHLAEARRGGTEREQQIMLLKQAKTDWQTRDATRNQIILETSTAIGALTASLTERTATVAERDAQIFDLKQAVLHRDSNISGLERIILERDNNISNLKQAISMGDSTISALKQNIIEGDNTISNLRQATFERDTKIAELNNAFGTARGQLKDSLHWIKEIEGSHSWRFMAPYRVVGTSVRCGMGAVKRSQIMTRVLVASLLLP